MDFQNAANVITKISFIIPVFNEEASHEPLFHEVKEVARSLGYQHDFVYINDGSGDNTLERIKDLARGHQSVIGVRTSKATKRSKEGKLCSMYAGSKVAL